MTKLHWKIAASAAIALIASLRVLYDGFPWYIALSSAAGAAMLTLALFVLAEAGWKAFHVNGRYNPEIARGFGLGIGLGAIALVLSAPLMAVAMDSGSLKGFPLDEVSMSDVSENFAFSFEHDGMTILADVTNLSAEPKEIFSEDGYVHDHLWVRFRSEQNGALLFEDKFEGGWWNIALVRSDIILPTDPTLTLQPGVPHRFEFDTPRAFAGLLSLDDACQQDVSVQYRFSAHSAGQPGEYLELFSDWFSVEDTPACTSETEWR